MGKALEHLLEPGGEVGDRELVRRQAACQLPRTPPPIPKRGLSEALCATPRLECPNQLTVEENTDGELGFGSEAELKFLVLASKHNSHLPSRSSGFSSAKW